MTAPKTNLLPPPSDEEYAALKASIAEGFWPSNPVVVDENGDILDGHTRARACHELGIDYPTVVRKGLTPWQKIDYAVRANVTRRQLSPAVRRQLLKRLKEEYDKNLRAEGEAARKAGNARGGAKSSPGLDETAGSAKAGARAAAADAAETRFDEPVVPIPAAPKVDRLSTLGNMLGRSRSTVANDEKILARMETIEKEARRQKRDDVLRQLDGARPNLDELERAVALRPPLPEVESPDADRLGWVANLSQALNNLRPALSDDEADLLWSKASEPTLLLIQLGQLRSAVAEAKARNK